MAEQEKRGPGRPATGHEPNRTIRCGDLWTQAEAKWHAEQGTKATMTGLVKRLLQEYVDRP